MIKPITHCKRYASYPQCCTPARFQIVRWWIQVSETDHWQSSSHLPWWYSASLDKRMRLGHSSCQNACSSTCRRDMRQPVSYFFCIAKAWNMTTLHGHGTVPIIRLHYILDCNCKRTHIDLYRFASCMRSATGCAVSDTCNSIFLAFSCVVS